MSTDGVGGRRRWRRAGQALAVVVGLLAACIAGLVIGRATAPGPHIVVAAAPVVEQSPKIESMPIGVAVAPTPAVPQQLVGRPDSPVVNGAANLPDTPATATGYRVVRTGLDGPALAAALGASLGVPGEVRDFADSWLVGTDDGIGASVRVMDDALMSWTYDDPVASGAAEQTAAPLQERAIALASALLGDLGVDVATVDWQVERGDSTTAVVAWQLVAGQRTQLDWSVVFGPGGSVVSASGFAAGLVELPGYPVVGARTAIERSATPHWSDLGAVQIAPPPAEPAPSPTSTVTTGSRVLTVAVPQITATDARLGLAQYWQPDGQLLILPSYVLTADDGSEWSLIAVANGYVAFVQPTATPAPRGGGEVR